MTTIRRLFHPDMLWLVTTCWALAWAGPVGLVVPIVWAVWRR